MLSLFGCGENKKQNNQEIPEITIGIGKYYKDKSPYIIKFPNKLPKSKLRQKMPNLVTILWKYDGKENNGLPNGETNEKMLLLEKEPKDNELFFHAYSRTGNNLKEIVYYCSNKNDFKEMINDDLNKYPVEISFTEDANWGKLNETIRMFNKN